MEAEHLLVFPDREAAELVAAHLRAAGMRDVRVVRETLSGEDDAEAHEWGVYVRSPDEPAYAVEFLALAERHDGWYDGHPQG